MATVNAGSAAPLDMTNLQIANLQYGNVLVYDAALVRIDDGGGLTADFHGSFVYDTGMGGMGGYGGYGYDYGGGGGGSYYPTAGTVTGVTEMANGVPTMDLSGVSVDAPGLFSLLQMHDVGGVLNALLGGDDIINGSPFNDALDGWGGGDTIVAGGGDDFVRGLDGNDLIDGGPGNDDVNGNRGEDVVHGSDGADFVRGGQGNDTVFGDAGDDFHVNGNIGDDIVHGDDGNDTVFGGQGNDMVFGDAGNDRLSGDLGDDVLVGGPGADQFLFRAGSGLDRVADFNPAEGDRIVLPGGTAYTLVDVNGEAVLDLGGGDRLTLTAVGFSSFNTGWVTFE